LYQKLTFGIWETLYSPHPHRHDALRVRALRSLRTYFLQMLNRITYAKG
jgi:hypothetical protein